LLRIATYNLENLDAPVEPRAPILRPALERLAADVLCLQEVNGQHIAGRSERTLKALDELLAGTRYARFNRAFTTMPDRPGVADVHNLVTLSRFPILRQRQVLHDFVAPAEVHLATADPRPRMAIPVRFDRPFLLTDLDLGYAKLTVVNVHMRAPLAAAVQGQKLGPFVWRSIGGWAEGYYLSGLKRSGQALELRLLIDSLFDEDPARLLAVAGDFNAEDHETPMRILIGAVEDTGNGALGARSMIPLERAIDPARRFSTLHHGRPMMLDHILASHSLYGRFRDIEVHNEALGDEAIGYAKNVEPSGSYHAAVVATFSIGAPV